MAVGLSRQGASGYFQAILFILLCFQAGIILWSVSRGFDITDEALYLFSFSDFREPVISLTGFQLVPKIFFHLADPGIIFLRLLRFVLVIIASIILFLSVKYFTKKMSMPGLAPGTGELAVILSFGMLTFCFGPLTLSYNSINSVLLLLFAANVLAVSVFALKPDSHGGFLAPALLIAGLITGLVLVNKPSTGFMLIMYCMISAPFYIKQNPVPGFMKFLQRGMIFLIGICLAFYYCFGNITHALNFLINLFQLTALPGSGYGEGIFSFVGKDFILVLQRFVTPKYLLVTILLITAALTRRRTFQRNIFFIFGILIIFYHLADNLNQDVYNRNFLLLAMLASSFAAILLKLKSIDKKEALAVLMFAALVFAGFIGSNVSFTVQVLFYAPLVFCTFYFALPVSFSLNRNLLYMVFLIANTCSIYFCVIKHPYRQPALTACNAQVEFPFHSRLIINEQSKNSISKYLESKRKNNLDSFPYCISKRDYLGYAYAAGQHTPTLAWISDNNVPLSGTLLKKIPIETMLNSIFVMGRNTRLPLFFDTATFIFQPIDSLELNNPQGQTDSIIIYKALRNHK